MEQEPPKPVADSIAEVQAVVVRLSPTRHPNHRRPASANSSMHAYPFRSLANAGGHWWWLMRVAAVPGGRRHFHDLNQRAWSA
jgi:hypothetical protein